MDDNKKNLDFFSAYSTALTITFNLNEFDLRVRFR